MRQAAEHNTDTGQVRSLTEIEIRLHLDPDELAELDRLRPGYAKQILELELENTQNIVTNRKKGALTQRVMVLAGVFFPYYSLMIGASFLFYGLHVASQVSQVAGGTVTTVSLLAPLAARIFNRR